MNTTAAAAQAAVTVATIRTWCRAGAVAAVKRAGRWVIEAASLAARISIGAMRAKRRTTPVTGLDLTATYTVTYPGDTTPTVITPTVRTRDRDGVQITTVRRLAPLLAGRIDRITDEGDRLHTLTVLASAVIAIRPDSDPDGDTGQTRDHGRLATTYPGTRDLPVSVVLDLAEQLRTTLGAPTAPAPTAPAPAPAAPAPFTPHTRAELLRTSQGHRLRVAHYPTRRSDGETLLLLELHYHRDGALAHTVDLAVGPCPLAEAEGHANGYHTDRNPADADRALAGVQWRTTGAWTPKRAMLIAPVATTATAL